LTNALSTALPVTVTATNTAVLGRCRYSSHTTTSTNTGRYTRTDPIVLIVFIAAANAGCVTV
jgi:hypothetical protein